MIEVTALCKRFGAHRALDDVHLRIRPGRVLAIAGPNGAGKTTLMKTVLGLTRPDGGRITMDGCPIGDDPAYRSRVGYMPQSARFPGNLTGAQLIALLKDLRGRAVQLDEDLVERFGLAAQLGKPLRTLSGGTRQKVNAALAFLFSPELLVLDEPAAGLDPLASSTLKDKILAVRGEGRTVILTSHSMHELEELADDIALLLDGRLSFAGTPGELKQRTRQGTLERAVAVMMTRGSLGEAA